MTSFYSDPILGLALSFGLYMALDRFFFPNWKKNIAILLLRQYRKRQALSQFARAYDRYWQERHLLEPEQHPLALSALVESDQPESDQSDAN